MKSQYLNTGKFVISLDYELVWGRVDKISSTSSNERMETVPTVVERILELFDNYKIHATWAVTGALFCKNKIEFEERIPMNKPTYREQELSSYNYYDSANKNIGMSQKEDRSHWGFNTLQAIINAPNQEVGTHTYSHYYCLEEGQTLDQFETDVALAVQVAKKLEIQLESIVFPRNQVNKDYLHICKKYGLSTYRGTEKGNLWQARSRKKLAFHTRLLRYIDSYIPISGYNTFELHQSGEARITDVPSSLFLRPFNGKLSLLEVLKLRRVKSSMKYAAKHGLIFHLWWHPHNFGKNLDENMKNLENILRYYKLLNKKYQFASCTMAEAAKEFNS